MKKLLTLGLVFGLGLVAVGCNSIKDDVYNQDLSNEDVAVTDEAESVKESFGDEDDIDKLNRN